MVNNRKSFLTFALMKRILAYILIILATCTACHEHDEIKPSYDQPLRRLVIVYMAAENSLTGYARADLAEMREATGNIPEDCALAVYVDNSSSEQLPEILLLDKQHGQRTLYTYPTDPISTDSASMQDILGKIIADVPAREHALVLWSHATGWMPDADQRHKTFGIDNGHNNYSNNGQQMSLTTLSNVLRNTGVHWQYIFYDACFMQCAEVAYQMRDIADWSIGSPAEIPAAGAPYDSIMPHLFQPEDFARDIPKAYHEWYNKYGRNGVVLSGIQSNRLEALAQTTAEALDTLAYAITSGIQQYCAYSSQTGWLSEFYDMASFMNRQLGSEDYARWQTVMQSAIPYRFAARSWDTSYSTVAARLTDTEHFAGTSMYLPRDGREGSNLVWQQLDWAEALSRQLAIEN